MKVLVTGCSGYFGTKVVSELLNQGHCVTGVDINPSKIKSEKFKFFKMNLINKIPKILENNDGIVHLVSVSRTLSKNNPKLARKINVDLAKKMAEFARNNEMKFIFASSCSVYENSNGICNEESSLNPNSNYAKHKVKVENFLKKTENLNWIILRFATIYGYSKNMRFDLLINKMIKGAINGNVKINKPKMSCVPFIHVKDAAKSIVWALNNKEGVYNVGSNSQNYTIKKLLTIFKNNFENIKFEFVKVTDSRNYQVMFDKIKNAGFSTELDVYDAILELKTKVFNYQDE